MPTLTQNQIDALKNKGLNDEKIRALALSKGYDVPKQSLAKRVGRALTKSERGFGQSIAGAIGGTGFSRTKGNIAEANQRAEQVKQNLFARVKEKRARGEDTSKLLGALKTLDSEVNFYDILNANTGGSLDKSGKQVFGEALGVATDIAGLGALPGGVGQLTKARTFAQGLKQGAKAGAIGGGIFGASSGAARSLQRDETGGEVVGSALRGAAGGAIGGGIIGGAIGGISGGITGRADKLYKQKLDYQLDLVSPRVTRKVGEKAGEQGRVTAPGLFKKAKVRPSSKEYLMADAIDDFVPVGAKPTEAVDKLMGGLSEIDNGLKGMINERNVPVSKANLASRLDASKDELQLIFASDKTAEKTYDAVIKEYLKHIKTDDLTGVFEARQSFDRVPAIKKFLESESLGENTRRAIVLQLRKSVNEFVSSTLPANNPLKPLLTKEHLMFEAIGNISSKNFSTIGSNKIDLMLQQFPWMKYLLYAVGTGVAFGAFGALGLGGGQR